MIEDDVPNDPPDAAKPKPPATVAELVAGNKDFSLLLAAVQAADKAILALLSNRRAKLTVFAPPNAAFEALLEDLDLSAEDLLGNKALVTSVLLNHVISGAAVSSRALKSAQLVQTALKGVPGQLGILKQKTLGVRIVTSTNQVAKVTAANIAAGRSIVHVVDQVLIPSGLL
ncbi:hypothetical protein CHLNCDRAFT_54976 [Chlorella variabilis]|uniref:FAS1 domain-containing protein n=1 Tax=Chlorella variabilis TaxID=554065 RepID=E1ZRB0_CHLVA|nr:hypothetical protein CHLNCDRAFT_54976 [Chlorella variabilis]EFN51538.1 hypothetical protein CHLNCDRAFT_54976 [Chlorella variabilis]|eukprot:XP_005843640.1 hypothetical protein CHLNCDRAFT_54976 [Chlorella variabilis]